MIGQPWAGTLRLGDLLRIHTVPLDPANEAELTRAHIPQPSFYLVRPDGHVGLCGTRFDPVAVKAYMANNLRLAV